MTDNTLQEQGPATKANDQAKSGGERDYGRSIRAAARGLLQGIFDEFQFIDTMLSTIRRGLTNAFKAGLKQAGAQPSDLDTPEYLPERLALDGLINENMSSLFAFSGFIQQRKVKYYDEGKKQLALDQVFNRALLWSNQYDKARVLAFTMASGDQKMLWTRGPTSDSCSTCIRFDGRVYRASTWTKHGALPKVEALCCHGFNCLCTLTPTDLPMTKGHFPAGALCK